MSPLFPNLQNIYVINSSMYTQIIMYKTVCVATVQLIWTAAKDSLFQQKRGQIFRQHYFRPKNFLLSYGCHTIFVVVRAL